MKITGSVAAWWKPNANTRNVPNTNLNVLNFIVNYKFHSETNNASSSIQFKVLLNFLTNSWFS